MKEKTAYKKVMDTLKKHGEQNLKELLKETGFPRGSLYRWLKEWKRKGKIGSSIRAKRDGIGVEEVFDLPKKTLRNRKIKDIAERLEEILRKKSIKENTPIPQRFLEAIAIHELKTDPTTDEFKEAVKIVRGKMKLLPALNELS